MGKKRRREEEGEDQAHAQLDADFERRLAEAVKTVLANAARYKDAIAAALPSRRAPRAAGEQAAGTHGPHLAATATAPPQQPRPAPAAAAAPAGPASRPKATAPGGGAAGVAEAAAEPACPHGAAHTGRPAKRQATREPQHAAAAEPTQVAVARGAAAAPAAAATLTPPTASHGASTAAPAAAHQPSSSQRAPRHQWQPDELQIILGVIRTVPIGEAAITAALKELGWDALPDPVGRIRVRVKSKLSMMRAQLDHGVDPEQVVSTDRRTSTRDKKVSWTAWVRQAFLIFPDYTGTADDVCAYMQANPDIAPLLDHRTCLHMRTLPRWKYSVYAAVPKVPGLTKTGEKRNGHVIYVYDLQAAAIKPGVGKRPRKQAGLPHLGKRS